jgi:hypothetical protein
MRLLVTGSRSWPEAKGYIIWGALNQLLTQCYKAKETLEVIHGDAGGVDAMAREWCAIIARSPRAAMVTEHRWPADWAHCAPDCPPDHRKTRGDGQRYCPGAGMRRNQAMVDTRPDRCYAYIRRSSPGASACVRMARVAGVPVYLWELRR